MIGIVGTHALDAGTTGQVLLVLALVVVLVLVVLVALVVVVLATPRPLAALPFLSSYGCKSKVGFCLWFTSMVPQLPGGTCVPLIAVFHTGFP